VLSDASLTKRQLSWLMLAAGSILAIASVGTYLLGLGQFSGFGPAKQQMLGLGVWLLLFGVTLLPLGDRPA
jgi:hypothetical protein